MTPNEAAEKTYTDKNYPKIIWTLFEGPFTDVDDGEYYTFTGSNGIEGEGYLTWNYTTGRYDLEIVSTVYYGN